MFTWLLLLILAGTTDTPVCACSAGLRAIQYIIPAIHGPEGRGRPSSSVGKARRESVAAGVVGGSSAGSFGGPATVSTARFLAPVVAPIPASTARAGWSDADLDLPIDRFIASWSSCSSIHCFELDPPPPALKLGAGRAAAVRGESSGGVPTPLSLLVFLM
eukprot:COSAG04_NODE_6528_length_1309_cov_4.546281_1_plen_160_part_10